MPAWKPSIFPLVSLGLGWPGPKFPKFIGRPGQRKTIVKTGGSSAQIFPKALHTESWREQNILLFSPPKVFGESSEEKSGLKTPIFPMVSFGLGGLGPKIPRQAKGNHRETGVFSPDFPQSSPQQILEKCWLENPQSSLWFLWPGWPGAQISLNLLGGQAKGEPWGKWASSAQIFPKVFCKWFCFWWSGVVGSSQ